MSSKSPKPLAGNPGKREFCRACAQFATGVAVAAVTDGAGAPRGITVNSFTSVSLDPPLVLICIAHKAPILGSFREAGYFSINMLEESQQWLSELFARQDRFEGVEWQPGATGAPLIAGVLAGIECRRFRIDTAGDHDIIIGEVAATRAHGGRPLIYYGSAYRRLLPR